MRLRALCPEFSRAASFGMGLRERIARALGGPCFASACHRSADAEVPQQRSGALIGAVSAKWRCRNAGAGCRSAVPRHSLGDIAPSGSRRGLEAVDGMNGLEWTLPGRELGSVGAPSAALAQDPGQLPQRSSERMASRGGSNSKFFGQVSGSRFRARRLSRRWRGGHGRKCPPTAAGVQNRPMKVAPKKGAGSKSSLRNRLPDEFSTRSCPATTAPP